MVKKNYKNEYFDLLSRYVDIVERLMKAHQKKSKEGLEELKVLREEWEHLNNLITKIKKENDEFLQQN